MSHCRHNHQVKTSSFSRCIFISNYTDFQDLKIPRHIKLPSSSSFTFHQDSFNSNHGVFSYFNQSLNSDLLSLVDMTSPMKVIKTNCSLPSKPGNCSYVQFEALLNIADRTVCKCKDVRTSVGNRCKSKVESPANPDSSHVEGARLDVRVSTDSSNNVSIFAVTPTYTRYTQKVDLTSLCYTVESVSNIIWIVVEDSTRKTDLVANLLRRCRVRLTLCST